MDDFISKTGSFSVMLKMEEDYKISFLFDNSKDEQENLLKDMIKTAPIVSDCPICDGSIHQTDLSLSVQKQRFRKKCLLISFDPKIIGWKYLSKSSKIWYQIKKQV